MAETKTPRCHYCGYKLIDGSVNQLHEFESNGTIHKVPLIYLQVPPIGYDFATIDHVQAKVNNGELYNRENLVLACQTCNTKKGKQSYKNFMKQTLSKSFRKNIHKRRIKLFRGWHMTNVDRRQKRLDRGKLVPDHYDFDQQELLAVDLFDDATIVRWIQLKVAGALQQLSKKLARTAERIQLGRSVSTQQNFATK